MAAAGASGGAATAFTRELAWTPWPRYFLQNPLVLTIATIFLPFEPANAGPRQGLEIIPVLRQFMR
jgi:hypothetical protein